LKLAESNGVKISKYEVIYELIDDVTNALEGMLEPEIVETVIGKLEIIKLFRTEKDKGIVGGKVISGKVSPGTKIRVFRGNEQIGEMKTDAIRVAAEKVNQVDKNFECGVSYIGDVRICTSRREIKNSQEKVVALTTCIQCFFIYNVKA
jgi:translation initiation factor IF-2